MKNTIISIGSMVVALAILGIPVFLMFSFIYNWIDFFKFVLIVATLIDFFGVTSSIYLNNSEE